MTPDGPQPRVVLDASALVDLLARTDRAPAVRARLTGTTLHAPAHLDAEVLSALGRLRRANLLGKAHADEAIHALHQIPLHRHELPGLLHGAWARQESLRLTDALYVELADQLHMPLLTTDLRLARAAPQAEAITGRATGR